MAAAVLGRTAAARTPRAEVGMRFSPVGWKAGARDSGVESPDVEGLDARAAVGMASAAAPIGHGCALRQPTASRRDPLSGRPPVRGKNSLPAAPSPPTRPGYSLASGAHDP